MPRVIEGVNDRSWGLSGTSSCGPGSGSVLCSQHKVHPFQRDRLEWHLPVSLGRLCPWQVAMLLPCPLPHTGSLCSQAIEAKRGSTLS